MIRHLLIALLSAALCLPAAVEARGKSSGTRASKPATGTGAKSSSTRVRGHVSKDGRYVPSHRRSTPDKRTSNNWSTKGNTNPYTGKAGSR